MIAFLGPGTASHLPVGNSEEGAPQQLIRQAPGATAARNPYHAKHRCPSWDHRLVPLALLRWRMEDESDDDLVAV